MHHTDWSIQHLSRTADYTQRLAEWNPAGFSSCSWNQDRLVTLSLFRGSCLPLLEGSAAAPPPTPQPRIETQQPLSGAGKTTKDSIRPNVCESHCKHFLFSSSGLVTVRLRSLSLSLSPPPTTPASSPIPFLLILIPSQFVASVLGFLAS